MELVNGMVEKYCYLIKIEDSYNVRLWDNFSIYRYLFWLWISGGESYCNSG